MIGPKRYPDSREGGIDIVVSHLAEEMVKKGHDVTIFVRGKKGYYPPKEYKGVKIERIFTLNSKSLDAIVYSYFATKKAKKGDFDVVHFHAEGNTLFLKKMRKSNKHVIVTIHGLDWKRGKFNTLGRKILLKSEKIVTKYADKVITLTKNDHDYFVDKYNLDTIVIPNGFEKPTYAKPDLIKEQYGLEKDSYILFLARIVPEKGLHFLIDAYKGIDTNIKLVVAGGSSHSLDYYEEVKKNADGCENIIFTDFVQGQMLDELFSNALFYVLPSSIEGMPLSLIEALTHNNICVCSDIKELKEVQSKNVIYFKSEDVEDLRRVLKDTIENCPSYKKERLFLDWEEVAEETLKVYDNK